MYSMGGLPSPLGILSSLLILPRCVGFFSFSGSKLFPNVFLAAAGTLGRAVGSANEKVRVCGLVLEDTIPGVVAGKRAGMSGAFQDISGAQCC